MCAISPHSLPITGVTKWRSLLKNIFSLLTVLTLIIGLSFAGCKEDSAQLVTTNPEDSDAPLSDLDPLFEGAPTNDELPADGKFDAVYPNTFDLIDTQSSIKSQGSRGVCSIFAAVALMEHLYIKEGTMATPDFSEQFLQWSVKKEVGSFLETEGSSSRYNLRAINRFGIVEETVWPYETRRWGTSEDARCADEDKPLVCYTNGDPTEPMLEAERFTLPPGRYVNSSTRSIKAFITENNQAVVAGMTFFYQSWNHRASPLKVNSTYWSEGYVLSPNATDKEKSLEKRAGHAILLLGWDDDLEVPTLDGEGNVINDADGNPVMEKGFFLFKNSWGTGGFGVRNKFGDGYGWLSYKYIKDHATVYGAGLPEVKSDEVCDDGKDNDLDDDIDCLDSDCDEDPACKPGLTFSETPDVAIPDNDAVGVSSIIDIEQPGTIGKTYVKVDIEHSYTGDLRVVLIAPDGTEAILHDRTGSSNDNIKETYMPLDFDGLSIAGEWALVVTDSAGGDTGNLISWSLEFQLTGTVPAEVCDDGIDNNGDGNTDCADATCVDDSACQTAENVDITNDTAIAITDNDPQGVSSPIVVSTEGISSSVTVSVDITHPFRGDLLVKLQHPDGTEVVLFNLEEYEENLVRTFTVTELAGREVLGTWNLVVVDQYAEDLGTLNSWRLQATVQ
jgi:subtilisin-like proprotein convertase family protein